MPTFRVELGTGAHDVNVGPGLLAQLGQLARGAGLAPGRAALVTDSNVAPLYAAAVGDALRTAGFRPLLIEVPAGESSKALAALAGLYDRLTEAERDRTSPIFALGGGVIGDLTGFAAATFMRGIPFVQVPTTLLAMVDSSVGGKTGVNHPMGKNMIGAFYQPKKVLMDLDVLKTLPKEEFVSGMAEVIKYGVIRDAAFFDYLEKNRENILSLESDALTHIIKRSCEIKAEVVRKDEREGGLRAILNFGHTVGHAIETAEN